MGKVKPKKPMKGKVIHPKHGKNSIRTQVLDRAGKIKKIIPFNPNDE